MKQTKDKEDDMKAKLLWLALPAALACGVVASAQSLGSRPASAGEQAEASVQRFLPPQGLPDTPAVDPQRKLPPPKQLPGTPELPPVMNQGLAIQYCTSTINSSGFNAWLDHTGDMSCCSNNTCLIAYGVPASTLGIFFFGSQPAQIPLGDGVLCVSPFYPGFYRLPAVTTTPYLSASTHVDLKALPAPVAITPGTTRYFQFWFRDPGSGGAQSNFSNGLQITFCF